MKKLSVFICLLSATVLTQAQAPTSRSEPSNPKLQAPGPRTFSLTVDSIMRGPDLVGYPPSELRWSGDSKELFFEWRMPKDDQASTWKVGRDGGTPTRLSDAQRRLAP